MTLYETGNTFKGINYILVAFLFDYSSYITNSIRFVHKLVQGRCALIWYQCRCFSKKIFLHFVIISVYF